MIQSLAVLALSFSLLSIHACSGRAMLGRGAVSRSLERNAEKRVLSTLERDVARDRASVQRILQRDRTVSRFTTGARARMEMRKGLSAGSHMTSHLWAGRPLSALHAQSRYGLPLRPQVRERIVLPKGTAVRMNKALGGEPGVGEITVVRHGPKSMLREVRRVK